MLKSPFGKFTTVYRILKRRQGANSCAFFFTHHPSISLPRGFLDAIEKWISFYFNGKLVYRGSLCSSCRQAGKIYSRATIPFSKINI